ncbi:serum response factor-like isoform X2 [Sander lucioperca]|uniref:serum response factor-like isoform X2 n=1 Tax=Sander lucioperca TaxID=283035 RepID=UPI00125CFD42|nr:serum response factor-like isoform X2 [Sander lucioperca]
MGTRTGAGLNTAGPGPNNDPDVISSGSSPDSDSGEDTAGSGGDRRGVKRERSEREVGTSRGPSPGGLPGAKPGKKTRGRVKIKMEFIDNKLRRYTTFSKRKTGIMKKAYELSTLTGTQVLLLVASETGHVYTFATRKLQPMITSETGKALIQTCLNSPDSPPRCDASADQRMSATGFQETELTYQVVEAESEGAKDSGIKPAVSVSGQDSGIKPAVSVCGLQTPPSSSVALQLPGSAPCWTPSSTNGTLLKTAAGLVLPAGFTLMSGGGVSQSIQLQPSTNQSSSDTRSPASSTASVSSSSSSSSGHMMYPGGHTVMYAAPASSLADGSLTVLNTQSHDPAALQQVFLTSLPPGGAQIPVQLHQMVISQQSSNLTELQVISLDTHTPRED